MCFSRESIKMLQIDANAIVAIAAFILHIFVNFQTSAKPSRGIERFSKLSIFPPAWIFSIWLVIWALQAALLIHSYGSGIWTIPYTTVFALICLGNAGSQYAGSKDAPWYVYFALLFTMFASSVLFMVWSVKFFGDVPFLKSATQLYVGWASIAILVGIGVILVCELQLVSDAMFTKIGLAVLSSVPLVFFGSYFVGQSDFRIVAIPYVGVLTALALRALSTHQLPP